jgi:hypothetical protein
MYAPGVDACLIGSGASIPSGEPARRIFQTVAVEHARRSTATSAWSSTAGRRDAGRASKAKAMSPGYRRAFGTFSRPVCSPTKPSIALPVHSKEAVESIPSKFCPILG